MNRTTGLIRALILGAAVGACASGGAGESVADGFRPKDNKNTRDAEQTIALAMLRQSDAEKEPLYREALESARMAIHADSTNPQGWFLVGQAHAHLGEYQAADSAWDKAQELYPEYEKDISTERENAWVRAYNEGVGALQADDMEQAISRMEMADLIYQGRPEAKLQLGVFYARNDEIEKAIGSYRGALEILRATPSFELDSATQVGWKENEEIAVSNLAQLLAASGREAEAENVFLEVLSRDPNNLQAKVNLADALAKQGKTEEANQLYAELISREDLPYADFLAIGVGLFQSENYEESANAFRKAVAANPYSRDGYYNLSQALFMRADKLEDARKVASRAEAATIAEQLPGIYTELAEAAENVLGLDPYNLNIIAYQARSYQAMSDLSSSDAVKQRYREQIQGVLKRHEDSPFEVMELNITPGSGQVTVIGRLTNRKLNAGDPIRLRIELLDLKGAVIGSHDVTVAAPQTDAATSFQASVPVDGELAGWRYDRVQ